MRTGHGTEWDGGSATRWGEAYRGAGVARWESLGDGFAVHLEAHTRDAANPRSRARERLYYYIHIGYELHRSCTGRQEARFGKT